MAVCDWLAGAARSNRWLTFAIEHHGTQETDACEIGLEDVRTNHKHIEGRQDLIIPLGSEPLPLTMPLVFLEPINAEEALVADAPCTVSQIDSLT